MKKYKGYRYSIHKGANLYTMNVYINGENKIFDSVFLCRVKALGFSYIDFLVKRVK